MQLPPNASAEAMWIATRAAGATSQNELAKQLKAEEALGLVWTTADRKSFLKNPAYQQGQSL